MINRVTRLGAVAAAFATLAGTVSADIKLNDNLSLTGYAVGLADFTSVDKQESTSSLDLQATKLAAKISYAPVSGMVSFYAGSDNKPVVLDAYATYDLGDGLTITGGKFLSWLGYEAFDPVNMITLSYAWSTEGLGSFPGIPAYHTGVKIETSTDTFAAGVAVVDSNESNYFSDFAKGDGDLDNGAGLEAYATLKGKALTVFLGAAYNAAENEAGQSYYTIDDSYKSYSADLWAQYVTGPITLAGEVALYKATFDTPGIEDVDTYFGAVWAKFATTDKLAYVGRIAMGKMDFGAADKPSYMKYTFAPIYTISANLELAAEFSYSTYDKAGPDLDSSTYGGVQARFKF